MNGFTLLRTMIPAIFLQATIFVTAIFGPTISVADQQVAPASGPILLEISGKISTTNSANDEDQAVLQIDRNALLSLPQTAIDTHTGWTNGIQQFEGVRLAELLDLAGADGSLITAIALNDYHADIPMSDLSKHDILVAHTWNGEPMRVRNRGPLWIIYPSGPSAMSEPSPQNRKMVWQLKKLEISD